MVIDFHSHILPGIDDGSTSVEQSIAMLRMEAEQGIGHVVATPHFYAHYDTPDSFLQRRNESEARLREEMEKHTGLPKLSVGAEVHFFPGISDSDALTQLTIAQNRYILIEPPVSPWPDRVYRELANIPAKQGITPIIAHVDRYIGPFRTYGIPEKLMELPVLVQANASFFLNGIARRMALRMLRENQIHLLGSDCHNLDSRAPNLGAAIGIIQQRLGVQALETVGRYQSRILLDL